jgi:hypothetical protein
MSTVIIPVIIPQNTAPSSYQKSYLGPDGTRIDVTFATGDQTRVTSLDNTILGAGFTHTRTPSSDGESDDWLTAIFGVPLILGVIVVAIYLILSLLAGVDWLPGTGDHWGAAYDRVGELMKGVIRVALIAWPVFSGLLILNIFLSREPAVKG